VLEVWLSIYLALKKWQLVEVVAKKLVDTDPSESKWIMIWAEALSKTGSV
jgi:hypothetical protein